MSTIAAKFSTATTRVKVGTAAVAVVAAATITPAIAQAAPDIASIATAADVYDVSELVVIPGGLNALVDNGSSAVAAVDDFNPITLIGDFVQSVINAVGTFVAGAIDAVVSGIQFVVNEIQRVLRIGPYAVAS